MVVGEGQARQSRRQVEGREGETRTALPEVGRSRKAPWRHSRSRAKYTVQKAQNIYKGRARFLVAAAGRKREV